MIGRSSIIGSYIQSAERLTSISDVQHSRKQEQLVKQYYKRYISQAVVLDGHGTPLSKQSGVVRLSRCVPESVESVVFSMAHSGAFSVSVTALERGILVHLSQPSSPGILAHISHTNGSKIPANRGFRLIPVGPGLVTRRKSAIFPGSFKERRTSTVQGRGGLGLRQPREPGPKTLLGAIHHAQCDTSHRLSDRNKQAHWMAHVSAHLFDIAPGKPSRHQGHAGTTSTRLQPGQDGHLHASGHVTEEQRTAHTRLYRTYKRRTTSKSLEIPGSESKTVA